MVSALGKNLALVGLASLMACCSAGSSVPSDADRAAAAPQGAAVAPPPGVEIGSVSSITPPSETGPGRATEISVVEAYNHIYGTTYPLDATGHAALVAEQAVPPPEDGTDDSPLTLSTDAIATVQVVAHESEGRAAVQLQVVASTTDPNGLCYPGNTVEVFVPAPWTPRSRGWQQTVIRPALALEPLCGAGVTQFHILVGGKLLTPRASLQLAGPADKLGDSFVLGVEDGTDGDHNEPILFVRRLPGAVAADQPGVRYVGRFDTREPRGARFAWPGSTIVARFSGTEVAVALEDLPLGEDAAGAPKRNFFSVRIDDRPVFLLEAQPGPVVYPIARDLPEGEHVITIEKRTEASVGSSRFLGLELGAGKLLPPPPPAERRMEIIGDSTLAGYGILGDRAECLPLPANQDATQAYGALTARALGADYVLTAFSGKGVSRNNNGDTHDTMPALYRRTLPLDETAAWDFAAFVPQVVVINFGSNDFIPGDPGEGPYTEAYRGLLQLVRQSYPEAHIFCSLGPTINDVNPPGIMARSRARTYVSQVIKEVREAGDTRVHFVEFPPQDGAKNGYGCHYHPNLVTHAQVAEQLTTAIKGELGW